MKVYWLKDSGNVCLQSSVGFDPSMIVKPWQNFNLGLLATPFGQALRTLALTCSGLCSPFGHSNQVNASWIDLY